jgi:hypothetical protein
MLDELDHPRFVEVIEEALDVGNWAPVLSTTATYNATGSPVTVTTPSGKTQYGYDSTQTFCHLDYAADAIEWGPTCDPPRATIHSPGLKSLPPV